jgi:hypothetical protein
MVSLVLLAERAVPSTPTEGCMGSEHSACVVHHRVAQSRYKKACKRAILPCCICCAGHMCPTRHVTLRGRASVVCPAQEAPAAIKGSREGAFFP